MPRKGEKHTAEAKTRISISKRGVKHTEAAKLARSKRVKGAGNPFYGKQHSEVTRKRISQALSGENHPQYGKKPTNEHRAKIAASKLGKPRPPHVGIAVSKSIKKLWADPTTREHMLKVSLENAHSRNINKGLHKSPKAGEIVYRSSYELAFYLQLDIDTDVASYEVETLRVPYIYDGKQHTYIPDILIHYIDGKFDIVELKPEYKLQDPQQQAKFKAAIDVYGDKFIVLTENDIFVQKG